MGKMDELSNMNDYDDNHLMMCEKEDLIQYINYLQGQLQESQDEDLKDELTETKKVQTNYSMELVKYKKQQQVSSFRILR